MKASEEEIRRQLKLLHVIFGLFVGLVAFFVLVLVTHYDPSPSFGMILFVTFCIVHLVLALALGSLAGELGKGGVSVGIAAFISTPVLAPISYARVVWWAHKALSNLAQGAKIYDELAVDTLPKMRAMSGDRL